MRKKDKKLSAVSKVLKQIEATRGRIADITYTVQPKLEIMDALRKLKSTTVGLPEHPHADATRQIKTLSRNFLVLDREIAYLTRKNRKRKPN